MEHPHLRTATPDTMHPTACSGRNPAFISYTMYHREGPPCLLHHLQQHPACVFFRSQEDSFRQPFFDNYLVFFSYFSTKVSEAAYLGHGDVPLDGFGVGQGHGHVARDSPCAGHDGILHVVDALAAWRNTYIPCVARKGRRSRGVLWRDKFGSRTTTKQQR